MKQQIIKFIQSALVICFFIAASLPGTAKAEYIYTYTSNPFPVTSSVITQVGDFDWITVENTFQSFLTAEIRTATLLTPGMGIDDVISLQFMGMPYEGYNRAITYPGPVFDPNSGYNPSIGGTLSIGSFDANGLPGTWNISLGEYVFLGGRGHYIEMATSNATDSISGYDEPYSWFGGTLSNNPGTWQLALVSPVPEPETYGMLLVGLGIIGLISRRRHQNNHS